MANAKEPIKRTFMKEGEITIDNNDTGGLTYLGLAHNSWPNVDVWPEIIRVCIKHCKNGGINVTAQELKNLGTKNGKSLIVSSTIKTNINQELKSLKIGARIETFYKSEFWDKISGDNIISQSFAESLFDFGINVYWKTAAKILQKLIKVTDDGIIGQNTCYVLNCELMENHHELHTQFALEKIKRYLSIVSSPGSTKSQYFHGWLNRTFETYEANYSIDVMETLIAKSSVDGTVGPKSNIKGYKLYLNNDEHFKALSMIIAVYNLNENYRRKKITLSELIRKIESEIK